MSHILNYLYVAAGVVFLFGAAIFVHEFGHFWVALKLGLKVEEFAIGFGPKIVAWTRNGIQYSLRWIPAGGFVKLPQMITSTALEGDNTESPPVPPAPALSKILVSIAGPAMNVVFAFALATLIYFVGLPVHVNPPIIGYVDPASPEGKMGIHEDDRIVALDGQPVKSWDDICHTTILALTNVFRVTILHDGVSNVYELSADTGNGLEDVKTLNLDPKDHLVVGDVKAGSAADLAHLKTNDEILSLAGKMVSSREELTKLVQAYGGKKTPLVVKRGNEKLSMEVTPTMDSSTGRFMLGITYASGKDVYEIEHPSPLAQVSDVWNQLYGTVVALVHPRDSGVTAKDLSGPVGIAGMLALEVKSDYRLALHFLVMLNINLAILNMLPIPVLDGGHIAMAILERIRRRPLEVRLVEYTTTVFAVLLISFMLYVTWNDITTKIPLMHGLFKRETQIQQPEKPAAQPSP